MFHLLVRFRNHYDPVCTPPFAHFPQHALETDDYMVGDALLVCPIVKKGSTKRQIALPKCADGWMSLWDQQCYQNSSNDDLVVEASLGQVPLFVRMGKFVLLNRSRSYSVSDVALLFVYPDHNKNFIHEGEELYLDYSNSFHAVIRRENETLFLSLDFTSTHPDQRPPSVRVFILGSTDNVSVAVTPDDASSSSVKVECTFDCSLLE
jgi:alpha-glucosidase (family GH31 glycosyl hydrolase)